MACTRFSTERVEIPWTPAFAGAGGGFLYDGDQGFLGDPTWLQKRRKITAFPEFWYFHGNCSGARIPIPLAIAIALIAAICRPLAVRGANQAVDIHRHHPIGDVADHFLEDIRIRALFNQVFQSHSVDGHGSRILSVRVLQP